MVAIRTDHRRELDQDKFINHCDKNGISHNFSAPRTLQHNGVVERKNKILEDIVRILICKNDLSKLLWAEAVNTANYVLNRYLIRPILKRHYMNYLNARN